MVMLTSIVWVLVVIVILLLGQLHHVVLGQQSINPLNLIQVVLPTRRNDLTRNATARINFADELIDVSAFLFRDAERFLSTYEVYGPVVVRRVVVEGTTTTATIQDDGYEVGDQTLSSFLSATTTETTWQGISVDPNRSGFCTLVVSSDGTITGTITTQEASYETLQLPSGKQEIRWTYWNEFPPDEDNIDEVDNDDYYEDVAETDYTAEDVTDTTVYDNNSNERDDESASLLPKLYDARRNEAQRGNASQATTSLLVSNNENLGGLQALRRLHSNATVVYSNIDRLPRVNIGGHLVRRRISSVYGSSQRRLNGHVVDILIVVSNRAMCEYAKLNLGCSYDTANGAMRRKISVIESETNNAMSNSNAQGSIRVVGILFLPEDAYDYTTSLDSLVHLRKNTEISSIRDGYGADYVSVIGGSGGACGRAYVKGISSVVSYNCLGQYSFTHEIGHNLGGLHDRDNCNSDHEYAHGYQYKNEYRTVMAYNCPQGCPRLLYFSTPTVLYKSLPVGDIEHNNARMVTERAPIAASRIDVPPTAQPTRSPTRKPTRRPTRRPTQKPTQRPTKKPTQVPTQKPTQVPTQKPTSNPTLVPRPTQSPEWTPLPTTEASIILITPTTPAPTTNRLSDTPTRFFPPATTRIEPLSKPPQSLNPVKPKTSPPQKTPTPVQKQQTSPPQKAPTPVQTLPPQKAPTPVQTSPPQKAPTPDQLQTPPTQQQLPNLTCLVESKRCPGKNFVHLKLPFGKCINRCLSNRLLKLILFRRFECGECDD